MARGETKCVARWRRVGTKHVEVEVWFDGEFCGILTLNKGQARLVDAGFTMAAAGTVHRAPRMTHVREDQTDIFI